MHISALTRLMCSLYIRKQYAVAIEERYIQVQN